MKIYDIIGLWARFWPKLDVLLLDNYLTLCMFTKSSIEGIDMFTFCRIYASNCLPIEVKKYDMYCRKKWEKKHEKIGTLGNECTTILTCVFSNVLFRLLNVPRWSMEKMKKFSEKKFFFAFWIFSFGKYSCIFYKKSWQQ